MTVRITQNSYGKSRVRLIKVARNEDRHEIQNLTVNIALEGDFEQIHTVGDNSQCLPTDTMKNTVYALAGETEELEQPEAFGRRLAAFLLANNQQVSTARIQIYQILWNRLLAGVDEHSHAFVKGGEEKRTALITATRTSVTLEAGIEDLVVLKTSGSCFTGFIKDKYTTLPDTTDRILSTAVKATWRYVDPDAASHDLYCSIREKILDVFANHDSKSVQHTLYAMGHAVLDSFEEIEEIAFSLPNIHCIPIDISGFGLENKNCIFVPTDEPHGLIEARVAR